MIHAVNLKLCLNSANFMRVIMKSTDQDLFSKLQSLPEDSRADLLEFLGISNISRAQVMDLEEAISTSIAIKNGHRTAAAH